MKKKIILFMVIAAAVYIALLALLAVIEGGTPGANIHNFGEAFWYSIVTLTTVGYGDYYPVSAGGRVIGAVFIILSVGVITAAIVSVLGFVRGRLLPSMKLRALRRRECCVFSAYNTAAASLASDILEHHPERYMVFCGADGEKKSGLTPRDKHILFVPDPVRETLEALRSGKGKRTVFLISENESVNYSDASTLEGMADAVYCRGREISHFPNVHFFDAPECTARLYWQEHPLRTDEQCVLIVGAGNLARAIMSQAVLVNCRTPFIRTEYHLFGDWAEYRRFHPELRKIFSQEADSGENKTGALQGSIPAGADGGVYDTDMMRYHESPLNQDQELLRRADRIIFCGDNRRLNLSDAVNADRFYALKAEIHTAAPAAQALEGIFGAPERIFTEELVTENSLDRRARALHEAYRGNAARPIPSWEELTPFARASNRAAADHLPTKVRILCEAIQPAAEEKTGEAAQPAAEGKTGEAAQPAAAAQFGTGAADEARAAEIWKNITDRELYRRNEHDRWMRFHCLYNWTYGTGKDEAARTHPSLVPFDWLSAEEQAKDDNAWEQIGTLL